MATKHGKSGTPEYIAWKSMITRCYNPNIRGYENYGGRGVTVSEEWKNDFTSFLSYVGDKPSPKHTLDRINVEGNYEPGNVRWATRTTQSRNRRVNERSKTQIRGVSFKEGKFCVRITTDNEGRVWVGRYETLEEAAIARKEAEKKYWGTA